MDCTELLVRDVFVFTNGAWLKEGMPAVTGHRSLVSGKTRRPEAWDRRPETSLHFHRRALLFQLGFDRRGLVLRHAALDRARRAVDEVLGFLQAQAGDLADHLDDLDLLAAGVLEQDVELGLLFHVRSARAT